MHINLVNLITIPNLEEPLDTGYFKGGDYSFIILFLFSSVGYDPNPLVLLAGPIIKATYSKLIREN